MNLWKLKRKAMNRMLIFIIISTLFLVCSGIILFFLLFQPNLSFGKGLIVEELQYSSSIDNLSKLYTVVAYPNKKNNLPIVVLMHEYADTSDRYSLLPSVKRFTEYGFFVISPDMRGRGKGISETVLSVNMKMLKFPVGIQNLLISINYRLKLDRWLSSKYQASEGKRDSGLKEVNDIHDAVLAVVKRYKNVDKENINIIGYSGGGGNVLSAVTRFPKFFRNGVSFFGISNYGYWYEHCFDRGIRQQLEKDVGCPPSLFPKEYELRNSLLCVSKDINTNIFLFFDEEEKRCPKEMNFMFKKAVDSLGLNNVKIFESKKEDKIRWRHGNPSTNRDLIEAEKLFLSYFMKFTAMGCNIKE